MNVFGKMVNAIRVARHPATIKGQKEREAPPKPKGLTKPPSPSSIRES